MEKRQYISVLLPLRLGWEPCYWTDEPVETGDRVRVPLAGKEYVGVVTGCGVGPNTSPSKIKGIIEVDRTLERITEEELEFWNRLAEYYMCSPGEVYKAAYPAGKVAKERIGTGDAIPEKDFGMPESVLSDAQQKACDSIRDGFRQGKVVLLEGVTGSGKTEIYLNLAAQMLAEGRNVLYMVPEIALGRQLADRLKAVFGDRLLTFHSGETLAHRRNVALKVRSGHGYAVLGTRSSLFLPHHDLGLIVVDEEHDSSYKQESPAPRYNGRDAAIMLSGVHVRKGGRCNVLLGSATPSLESRYNCLAGKFHKVELHERFYGSADAEIEIIDTIAERKKRGMKGVFSRKLIDRMEKTLERGEQIIVLRARRSYSPVLQCRECGFIPKCPYCNVSLSHHKQKDRMVCHYCGHSVAYDEKCPECGGQMSGLGAGTQKVEEELAAIFPQAKIARLDSDTAQSKVYEKQVIKGFSKGEIDILVGTQMVTKGFDFPGLTLVAVLQADTLMGMQDFRADEKAMQVLEQFRGRCGRRDRKGLFVIQTSRPEHPVYQAIANGLAAGFGCGLLDERKAFGYPPFTRVVNVTVKDTLEERTVRMAEELSGVLKEKFPDLTGPFVPGTGMAAGSHLRMMRICLRRDKALADNKLKLKRLIQDFETLHRYQDHIVLDVDPS